MIRISRPFRPWRPLARACVLALLLPAGAGAHAQGYGQEDGLGDSDIEDPDLSTEQEAREEDSEASGEQGYEDADEEPKRKKKPRRRRQRKRQKMAVPTATNEQTMVRFFEFDAFNWTWDRSRSVTEYPNGTGTRSTSTTNSWDSVYNSFFALSFIGKKSALHVGRNYTFRDSATIAYGRRLFGSFQLGPTLDYFRRESESENSSGTESKSKSSSYTAGLFGSTRMRIGSQRLNAEARFGGIWSDSENRSDGFLNSGADSSGWYFAAKTSYGIPITTVANSQIYYLLGVSYTYRSQDSDSFNQISGTRSETANKYHTWIIKLASARVFF